jgi:hypothetical protein
LAPHNFSIVMTFLNLDCPGDYINRGVDSQGPVFTHVIANMIARYAIRSGLSDKHTRKELGPADGMVPCFP